MASHVKGFITALFAMFVFAGCMFTVQYFPAGLNEALNVWWIGLLAMAASIFLYFLADELTAKSLSGIRCFFLKGFVHPIAIFCWVYILIMMVFTSSIESTRLLSTNILSFSSWMSAIIAFVIVLFFAIIYSSIKQNGGGFARFILMIAILALIYGVYAFFTYLVKDVILITEYISCYGYLFFVLYVNDYAVYEVCEDNKFNDRLNTLTRVTSVFKKI